MPAKPLLDFDFLKNQEIKFGIEEIRKINPQRFEMEHLNAIIHLDLQKETLAGYKDVTENEFWVKGHLPDRPLLPGVIMLEAGAQLSSFYFHTVVKDAPFFGFAGLDDVRFRGTVIPGNRLYLAGKAIYVKRNRGYFHTQGIVDGKVVFDSKVLGMAV